LIWLRLPAQPFRESDDYTQVAILAKDPMANGQPPLKESSGYASVDTTIITYGLAIYDYQSKISASLVTRFKGH
jgi:hypothetical protein